MNGIILKEAEGEEEPPSMGEFSLEQLLGIFNPSKSDFTGLETSSETEVPKPELLELSPEEGNYSVLTDEETDYFVPEVTKTESIKPIQSVWADYSFLGGRDAEEITLSLEEGRDSLYSSLYPQGEKDLLKV